MALYVNSPGFATAWTRIPVTVNAQDQDITFDGESNFSVEVFGYIINAQASASTLTIQPNALSTNGSYQELFGAAGAPGATSAASMLCGFNAASAHGWFSFRMFTKTGTVRPYDGQYTAMSGALAITSTDVTSGRWNDTSTAITSLRIHSDQANGLGVGSYFVYRFTPLL